MGQRIVGILISKRNNDNDNMVETINKSFDCEINSIPKKLYNWNNTITDELTFLNIQEFQTGTIIYSNYLANSILNSSEKRIDLAKRYNEVLVFHYCETADQTWFKYFKNGLLEREFRTKNTNGNYTEFGSGNPLKLEKEWINTKIDFNEDEPDYKFRRIQINNNLEEHDEFSLSNIILRLYMTNIFDLDFLFDTGIHEKIDKESFYISERYNEKRLNFLNDISTAEKVFQNNIGKTLVTLHFHFDRKKMLTTLKLFSDLELKDSTQVKAWQILKEISLKDEENDIVIEKKKTFSLSLTLLVQKMKTTLNIIDKEELKLRI